MYLQYSTTLHGAAASAAQVLGGNLSAINGATANAVNIYGNFGLYVIF